MIQPPQVDARNAADVATALRRLLPSYVGEESRGAQGEQLTNALVQVFARFSEILIDRLNKAPERNFLAFLDLLGVSKLPQQAAKVPVTFYLSAERAGQVVVPERTQVAGQPLKGEQQPVIFETDRELVVVSTKLQSLVAKDGAHDQYADLNSIVPQAPPAVDALGATAAIAVHGPGKPAFSGDKPLPHLFYIGFHILVGCPVLDRLVLHLVVEDSPKRASRPLVAWEMCVPTVPGSGPSPNVRSQLAPIDPDGGIAALSLQAVQEGTDNLTKSGDVIFEKVTSIPSVGVHGVTLQWLRCRLLSPIDSTTESTMGTVRAADLPRIKEVSAEFEVSRQDLLIEQAYFNNLKLDLSKDFYPFGQQPKFGDVLYLGSSELFSNPDSTVSMHIEITNPVSAGAGGPIVPTAPQDVLLSWEFWDGSAWDQLGIAESPAKVSIITPSETPPERGTFSDTTKAFAETGDVTFTFPKAPRMTLVNGQTSFWVRVRIISGNYGREAHIDKEVLGHVAIRPSTYAPPAIHAIKSNYRVHSRIQPQAMVSYNDFSYTVINPAGTFLPFVSVEPSEINPALYFGFLPPSITPAQPLAAVIPPFPNLPERAMSIYVAVGNPVSEVAMSDLPKAVAPVTWEYWNGSAWTNWTVRDDSAGFSRSGLLRFPAPPDFMPRSEFGLMRYWLRAKQGSLHHQPRLYMLLLNTTMASHGTTSLNEALGVSNGMPLQSFPTTVAPILPGQQLQVMEPRRPDYSEQKRITREEGADAIVVVTPKAGPDQIWVRWHEVPNFYSSGARDRHYVLDRQKGIVSFGDGEQAQIPPRGGKVRMATYRAGGGSVGNRPVFNISQLKTAVPYVDKICNWVAAAGGGDIEPTDELMERGARAVRHGGRAITVEDFEDLAMLASPEVARTKCVPLRDLAQERELNVRKAGVVSVIVAPRTTDPRPVPNSILLGVVQEFLSQWQSPAARVVVVVPNFIRVDVWTEVAVEDPDTASGVELTVTRALGRYLHPLIGSRDGKGWAFGRMPHKSDLYALIEGLDGVSHVRDLRLQMVPDWPGLEDTNWFLICGGNFSVAMSLEK